jgi:hypothetical protein
MRQHNLIPFLLFSGLLALTAITGLGLIFIYLPPTIGPRWLFFFFLFLAVSSISLPIFALINQRLDENRSLGYLPPVREAMELGLYVNLIVWLKFGRVLDTVTAILILAVFIAIEVLIRMIEQSRFKPKENERDTNEE